MQKADEQLDFSILDKGILIDNEITQADVRPVRQRQISARGCTKAPVNRKKNKQKRRAQRKARKAHA